MSRAQETNNYNSFSDSRDEGNNFNSFSAATDDERVKEKLLPPSFAPGKPRLEILCFIYMFCHP